MRKVVFSVQFCESSLHEIVLLSYLINLSQPETSEMELATSCGVLCEMFKYKCSKNILQMLTVSEMFSKHLMQLKGVSAERAMALVEKYPTPLL